MAVNLLQALQTSVAIAATSSPRNVSKTHSHSSLSFQGMIDPRPDRAARLSENPTFHELAGSGLGPRKQKTGIYFGVD